MARPITVSALLSLFLVGCAMPSSLSDLKDSSWLARGPVDPAAFHDTLLTVDTHVDIPLDFATAAVDPGKRGEAQVDLIKMTEGNLNAAFFIVYVGQAERNPQGYKKAYEEAVTKFEAIHRMAETMYPDQIELATSVRDIKRIRRNGKLVALIGLENAFSVGTDLSRVDDYYERGLRYAGFAHFGHNDMADSSRGLERLGDKETEHEGLSALGKDYLASLNRLGIMADVSHSSQAATLDVCRLSTAPVIASHSGVKGIYDFYRNLSDEELVAIKDTGGVVQIVAFDTYLKEPPAEKVEAVTNLREKHNVSAATWPTLSKEDKAVYQTALEEIHKIWPRASVSVLADHIDYAVQLIGIDHVGIASDFGGGGGIDGWMDASQTPSVTQELLARGYSRRDIKKIWGGNLLRVMRDVERRADK